MVNITIPVISSTLRKKKKYILNLTVNKKEEDRTTGDCYVLYIIFFIITLYHTAGR